jgi:hypothetical protein
MQDSSLTLSEGSAADVRTGSVRIVYPPDFGIWLLA